MPKYDVCQFQACKEFVADFNLCLQQANVCASCVIMYLQIHASLCFIFASFHDVRYAYSSTPICLPACYCSFLLKEMFLLIYIIL